MFVLIFGISGSVYQFSKFLLNYLTYPVVVDLKVESKLSLDFSAVTDYNLNRMRRRFVKCMVWNLPFKIYTHIHAGRSNKVPLHVISERWRNRASCSKQFRDQKNKNVEDVT